MRYEDIRLVEAESLDVTVKDVAEHLAELIDRFCQRHGMNYCVFDFLVDDDHHWLTDVTPNGSWSWYEKSCAVPLTSLLGDVMSASM
jgi:hypothetical protein